MNVKNLAKGLAENLVDKAWDKLEFLLEDIIAELDPRTVGVFGVNTYARRDNSVNAVRLSKENVNYVAKWAESFGAKVQIANSGLYITDDDNHLSVHFGAWIVEEGGQLDFFYDETFKRTFKRV